MTVPTEVREYQGDPLLKRLDKVGDEAWLQRVQPGPHKLKHFDNKAGLTVKQMEMDLSLCKIRDGMISDQAHQRAENRIRKGLKYTR
jgi:hypothetical protein